MGSRTPQRSSRCPTIIWLASVVLSVNQDLDAFTEDILVGSHSFSLLAPQFLVVFAHLFRIGFDSFFKIGNVLQDLTTFEGKFANNVVIRADVPRQCRSLFFHTILHRSCVVSFVSHFIFLCTSVRLFVFRLLLRNSCRLSFPCTPSR